MSKKVFLGGTCGNSKWRDELIPLLNIEYFNPVVDDWTPECQAEEIKQRKECDFCLYVITPETSSTYSIAEVVDDSNKRPDKTIFCLLKKYGKKEFDEQTFKHILNVSDMVSKNIGRLCFSSIKEIADYLNQ